jgi:hypothetical protein
VKCSNHIGRAAKRPVATEPLGTRSFCAECHANLIKPTPEDEAFRRRLLNDLWLVDRRARCEVREDA